MDIAFAVALPSDLERFRPIARRLPGAEFVLPAGRWPSAWLDSRRWTEKEMRRRHLRAAPPRRQFSLILAGPGISTLSLRPWLRRGGRVLSWPRIATRFGDPRLDTCALPGARGRGLHRLGLSGERPIWIVAVHETSPALERCLGRLAAFRTEAELVVVASEAAWLRSRRPLPEVLRGPAVHRLRGELSWGVLLSTAEKVFGDDRRALCDAAAVGIPALLLASRPGAAAMAGTKEGAAHERFADLLPVVFDSELLPAAIHSLDEHWRERELERRRLGAHELSAPKLARALARAQARIAIDRVLRTIS